MIYQKITFIKDIFTVRVTVTYKIRLKMYIIERITIHISKQIFYFSFSVVDSYETFRLIEDKNIKI